MITETGRLPAASFSFENASSIGIFGGTFDPIHTGHLILAERAREELDLDVILFMPARVPPHKVHGRKIASGNARLQMIRLAIESNPAFRVTELELEREGVSYTVDSLEEIHRRAPGSKLLLLMGSDNARDFASWRQPDRILELVAIGVWERPGSYYWPEVYPDYIPQKVSSPLIEISSTDIRNRVAAGGSIRYMTPDPVCDYIEQHGIYR